MDNSILLHGRYSSLVVGSNFVTLSNTSNSVLSMDKSIYLNGLDCKLLLSSNQAYIRHQESNFFFNIDESVNIQGKYSKIIAGSNYSLITNNTTSSILMSDSIISNTATTIVNNAETRFNSNISLLSKVRMCHSNYNDAHWEIYLSNPGNSVSSDIVFKSKNGTMVAWTDDFYSEILNFTGKHRCSWVHDDALTQNMKELEGTIVVSTGIYKNLDDDYTLSMDEAIPIVELANKEYDSRAFGVISAFEPKDDVRRYRLGNLQFSKSKQNKESKIIVNSVGEGAIWVVNCNGNFKNGDLITTSSLNGYGMKQKSKNIKSYTVAKITCDCNFNIESTVYKCEEFAAFGRIFKRALVGCVYKF